MEISIENSVIADPTIVDANPDIEGSDNEEAIERLVKLVLLRRNARRSSCRDFLIIW